MADPTLKAPGNVPGSYYVDESCINCGLCYSTTPECFSYNEETSMAYVAQQPVTEDEKESCKNALEACPVNAIGYDDTEL